MNSTCKTNMRNTGNKQRTNTRNLNITQMNWSNVSGAEDRRCFISTTRPCLLTDGKIHQILDKRRVFIPAPDVNIMASSSV